jgi:cytochrome o ubiquinol oxidase subunit II
MELIEITQLLDPHGPIGRDEKTILIDSLAIMLAIVIPTILATLVTAWWYRASNARARHLPQWSFSGGIELLVWFVPMMVIILLGGVTWIGSHRLDPSQPLASGNPPIDIQVVSLDWKWLFIYPNQGIASLNQLVVPTGVPIRFSLTSASVLNAFFVPQLGSMIYTMNGMVTHLNLQADDPGVYRGLSSHFSGDGFSDMHFELRAISPDRFGQWVTATQGAGAMLNSSAYGALTRQSVNLPASTFGGVESELFNSIVSRRLSSGPGPETDTAQH